jgi:hypothetical protein
MTGRAELLRAWSSRPLDASDAKALVDILGALIETNQALREHAEQLSQIVGRFSDGLKGLQSTAANIEKFASFRHDQIVVDGED